MPTYELTADWALMLELSGLEQTRTMVSFSDCHRLSSIGIPYLEQSGVKQNDSTALI